MSMNKPVGRHLFVIFVVALLLPGIAGCDSSSSGLEAEFFVGTWTLESARDGSGDRTSDVFEIVEVMRITFGGGGTFDLFVGYTEAADHPDRTFTGTYSVTRTGQLVLTSEQAAMSFEATAQGNNRVDLRAPAVLVESVIAGTELDIGLQGMVTLTIVRS